MSSQPPQISFIDVSGVGNSGKSAVVDLLREVAAVYAPEYWFEFDFIRVPGGLLDLRNHLVADWSPIRSHAAVHAFLGVVDKMGRDPAWWDIPGLLACTSQRYDRRFLGRFSQLSKEFVRSFVIGSYRAEWPYDDLRENSLIRFGRKILRRLGARRDLSRDVLLVDGAEFDLRGTAFLQKLFQEIIEAETEWVVLNNGFEPFNPLPALDMISGSRQIVVTRDPRDIYVSGLNAHSVGGNDKGLLAFDNDGMNKSFLATDDLNLFIRRYRLFHEKLYDGGDPRVFRVRFEDLVRDYEISVARLLGFLGMAPECHVRPRTCFDPDRSSRNIALWRSYSRKDEIGYIEQHLPEFLVSV